MLKKVGQFGHEAALAKLIGIIHNLNPEAWLRVQKSFDDAFESNRTSKR